MCPQLATPPICWFDRVKGEYVCPAPAISETTASLKAAAAVNLPDFAVANRTVEGLHKCTRERQCAMCKSGRWKIAHRCATRQQCDTKDGNFCCRTRGIGLSC
ncbi:hypothetical protein SVAN01_02794 [Stagonosporopsis vannaccii]|nr:hypothetical protein SVAN01_02794 [Stagonosporopsis vannaccii]